MQQLESRPPTRYLVKAYRALAAQLKQAGKKEGALDLLERALGVSGDRRPPDQLDHQSGR